MFAKSFKEHAIVGDEVTFRYKGELRGGKVVELAKTFVRVETKAGFRCFSYEQITELKNHSMV